MKAPRPRATIIGWREHVSLPEWNVERISAKADTGARTSAIDVANLEELPGERVRFDIVVHRGEEDHHVTCEADVVRRSRVKSAHGTVHDRVFIRTTMRLGPVEKMIELGLVSRRKMLCRMLLGRRALRPEFLVDPGRRYLFDGDGGKKRSGKPKRRRIGEAT